MLWLPFVKIVHIFAVSQSGGNSPMFSDCLKTTSNMGAISVEQFLSIASYMVKFLQAHGLY